MTGNEILLLALSLVSEGDTELGDYDAKTVVRQLNITLAECFVQNNAERVRNGLAPFKTIPAIEALSDNVPYEEKLLRSCIAYGLITKIAVSDSDYSRLAYLAENYKSALSAAEVSTGTVRDTYE